MRKKKHRHRNPAEYTRNDIEHILKSLSDESLRRYKYPYENRYRPKNEIRKNDITMLKSFMNKLNKFN